MSTEIQDPSLRKSDRELAQKLVASKLLSNSELGICLAELRKKGTSLHEHIVRLGFISESVLRDIRANLLHLPVIDLTAQKSDPTVHKLLTGNLARTHQMIPVARAPSGDVLIALNDPGNLLAIDQINAHLRSQGVMQTKFGLSGASELHREIDRVYGERVTVETLLTKGGKEPPMDQLVEAVMQLALDHEASDVHFEPDQFFLRIRLRIDGVLQQTHLLHSSLWAGLCVRLKVMAGMNIAENRAAQDGRFSLKLGISTIDFRVACLPTAFGENMVLRLLDSTKNIVPLPRIDMGDVARSGIHKAIAKPEGIILVTGPTGSGKTTTLYSILAHVSTEEVNVMTLEDPIEYPLPLIRQTQVNDKISFADGIRALMRQDPDIILVGEIRDQETAEMAFRAAMTGHQVFATLHTNSALQSVQRLRDIGVSSAIMAGNLIAAVGQRLTRKLCPHCKAAKAITAPERELLQPTPAAQPICNSSQIFHAVGCEHCHGSGYRGRVVLVEVLNFDERLDELIATNAPLTELSRHARASGFVSLRDEAARRVLAGDTTVEEVSRVVSLALKT